MPKFDRPPQDGAVERPTLPEGIYQGVATQIRPGSSHESKTPYVAVDFQIHAPGTDWHDHRIDIKLWDTERAYNFAVSRLMELVDITDFGQFQEQVNTNKLSEFDDILHHFKTKNQWFKLKVEHTPRKNDPTKNWANVVKVQRIDPPEPLPAPQAAAPSGA